MNEKNSLIVSTMGHVLILLLCVVVGLIARNRVLSPVPVRVDLLAPLVEAQQPGTTRKKQTVEKKPAKKPEKKPEIITRKKEEPKPTYDPSLDMAKLEKLLKKQVPKEETRKETPVPEESRGNTSGIYGSSSAYDSIIQQIVRNNWIQPSRAILGADPPVVLVTIRVNRRGRILSSRITQSSRIPQLDDSVLKAIDDSNPLPEFPSYMTGTEKDFELRFIVED